MRLLKVVPVQFWGSMSMRPALLQLQLLTTQSRACLMYLPRPSPVAAFQEWVPVLRQTWPIVSPKRRKKHTAVFNALADTAALGLRSVHTLQVAKLCWAFGSVNHAHASLLEQVALESQERVADFTHQSLANIVWAFARLGCSDAMLRSSCSVAIVGRSEEFNAQDGANTIWAYAKLRVIDVAVFRAMFIRAQVVYNDMYRHHTIATAQDVRANLAQLYLGYEVCRHGCPEALAGLDASFVTRLQRLHEQRDDLLSSIGESDADLDALVADLRSFLEAENSVSG